MDNRRTLGRYELLAELGHGAMGVVYQARDPQIDRLVAIKTISLLGQSPEDERDYLTRFFLEARAAGKLSHPGIVTIFDVGEEPETRAPYIVMEYVRGRSLSKLLEKSSGKLPLGTSLKIAAELAEALDYAHVQGVVHRDMKPDNVLMTTEGRAKIADFGIAKINLAQITLPGNVLGTPAFMSPEQLEGGAVDGRSDLFSLGVILYTMLTGHRPFQGNSALTVSFKVLNSEPVPATAFNSELPPEIDYVISRAMAKVPSKRYQTGREMASDINDLLRERTTRNSGEGMSPNPGSGLSASAIHILDTKVSQSSKIGLVLDSRRAQARPPFVLRPPHFVAFLAVGLISVVSLGVSLFHSPAFSPAPAVPAPAPPPIVAPTVARSSSTASVVAPKVVTAKPVAETTLTFQIEHPFTSATMSLWLDGKLYFTQPLHGQNKRKLVLFHGVHQDDSGSLRLPAGKHLLQVRIVSSDGLDVSKSVTTVLRPDRSTTLQIKCDKTGKQLNLDVR